jgi:polyvinyl alcohol dehydrogenase (cytochrome)
VESPAPSDTHPTASRGRPPRRVLGAALLVALLVAGLAGVPASGAVATGARVPGCSEEPEHPGGDWRHYGADLVNSRTQLAEGSSITAADVADLEPAWTYSVTADNRGTFYMTPIVYAGCVFLTTSTGHVVVRNADTGDLVWQTDAALPGNSAALIGGVTTGSPAVSDDLWIYVSVLRTSSPYVAAFRPTTTGGWELAWTTTVDETPNAMIVSGPLLYDVPAEVEGERRQLLYQGFMGAESTATPRGGYAFLDPTTGAIVAKGYTIDDEDYANGFRGASIWGQSAIDPETLYVYSPTGNPANKNREHPNSNAVVKIDGDPTRETFGRIVGVYKGNPDNYVGQVDLYNNPVCQSPLGNQGAVWGQFCLQQDLDFGSPPNIWTDGEGRRIVGALQKSGIYHAIDADTMERVWGTIVGGPGVPVNAAATAMDGERIFVNAQPPGQLWGLDGDTGVFDWVQPMGDVISYLPPSSAGGVVFGMDAIGNLRMTDAETGLLLGLENMTMTFGTLTVAAGDSPGIAIARDMVYVAIPQHLIAYRVAR